MHALKIKHFPLGHQVNKMWSAVEQHIGKELGLVNLTGICAWRSNSYRDLVFHQIGEIIIRTISGYGLFFEVPRVVGPQRAILNEKYVNVMSFLV